jgi:hypothetical protein
MTRRADEPPGWRELCAKLRTAKEADEFQAILDQINRLLTDYEKSHPEGASETSPAKPQKAAKKAKAR